MNQKKVHYLCYGINDKTEELLKYFPSAQPKISYLIDSIKAAGYQVNMVSSCMSNRGFFKRKRFEIDEAEKHIFFSSFYSKFKLFRKLSLIGITLQTILYVLFKVKKGDCLLVYHSLNYILPLKIINGIFKKPFILEVEEFYSAVNENHRKFESKEIEFINSANGYLLVNDLMKEKIDLRNKPMIISYGNYKVPLKKKENIFKDSQFINIVYAGVIEDNRKAAFLAAKTARYLNENYKIHILGFGNNKDIKELRELINNINTECGSEKVIFHGKKSGNQYTDFLQSCDIALSCHTYSETEKASADYTFPSKIITYLANNLRVVSADIRCVRESMMSSYILFYEENSAMSIARAIKEIDINTSYNSKNEILNLDREFILKLSQLFNETKKK
ncbi:glycosyltransferase [Sporosarcina sp. YIM B06819]|uniref:glycosyltransferase n=1 Tax=Sporosarcina sp. YIM B06819 TaxID=3081769 RepID=UPI00298C3E94|nr:glycosyltransferase [Sporosarcina sp. YIM B06819]